MVRVHYSASGWLTSRGRVRLSNWQHAPGETVCRTAGLLLDRFAGFGDGLADLDYSPGVITRIVQALSFVQWPRYFMAVLLPITHLVPYASLCLESA